MGGTNEPPTKGQGNPRPSGRGGGQLPGYKSGSRVDLWIVEGIYA
jgi:hypothetical protein